MIADVPYTELTFIIFSTDCKSRRNTVQHLKSGLSCVERPLFALQTTAFHHAESHLRQLVHKHVDNRVENHVHINTPQPVPRPHVDIHSFVTGKYTSFTPLHAEKRYKLINFAAMSTTVEKRRYPLTVSKKKLNAAVDNTRTSC